MRNMQRKYGYFMKEKSLLQLHAYDSIKNSILSGELEPRVLYSETKLSAQIGISRTPMREALQSLSQDGYITIIPSKGFMIRQYRDTMRHRGILYQYDRVADIYRTRKAAFKRFGSCA